MTLSPETSDRVDQLRARAGLPPDHPEAITTLAECKAMIDALREGRRAAADAQSKKRKAKEPIDINKVLEGF